MMRASVASILCFTPFALGEIGEPCTYDGIEGACRKTSDCDSGIRFTRTLSGAETNVSSVIGFVVDNYCPNDSADVKCCLTQACTDVTGKNGSCLNNQSSCDESFSKDRCPGPVDVQCCVTQVSLDDAEPDIRVDIIFWIKAFIPLDVENVTYPWPNHLGKTMLDGKKGWIPREDWMPGFGPCFATDQRTFNSAQDASAQMHSEARVGISASGNNWSQAHHCDHTMKIDCDDGVVEDALSAGTDDMVFYLEGSSSRVILDYNGKAKDSLATVLSIPVAPLVDIAGTLTIDRLNKFVEFSGAVDDFPAFEAYALLNGFGPYTVATLGPETDSDATSLAGFGAKRDFQGRLYI